MSRGPGDPDCPVCLGQGVKPEIIEDTSLERGSHPPRYHRCQCVLQRDIAANVERGMRKLMQAPRVESSPLTNKIERDLWVTVPRLWFMGHLRHVAIRQPPTWYFKVVTDADLMTAWLASVALKGKDILDPDAAKISMTHLTLVDLAMPPELLIIRLGIKQARNVASPEVFLEALRHREHAGLPTWVWDTPDEMLDVGHICHSTMVEEYMAGWKHLRTREAAPAPRPMTVPTPNPHNERAARPDRPRDVDPDNYEDQAPKKPKEAEEIEDLKGVGGHVDLQPKRPFRPTMSSGSTRKGWFDEGEDE